METDIQIKMVDISLCEFNEGQVPGLPSNPRTREDEKQEHLVESIKSLPEMSIARSLLVYPHNGKLVVIGGNRRLEAFKHLGYKEVPVITLPEDLPAEKLRRITILDNESTGKTDWEMIRDEWNIEELEEWGVDLTHWNDAVNSEAKNTSSGSKTNITKLSDIFIVPPFSIIDTRKGEWQKRKKEWREVLGRGGDSREETLITSDALKFPALYKNSQEERKILGISFTEYLQKYVSEEEKEKYSKSTYGAGVSLFDPALAEILCLWFTPITGKKIFDPFAGDTQKGAVFSMLGYEFKGVEIRKEQVEENNGVIQLLELKNIEYFNDDGQNVDKYFDPESQDLLFSCPPYFDLEVYSDLENDASNQKDYESFIQILDNAFSKAICCLKENRFAVIVVGDVRNKKNGSYYDFCGSIKDIFKRAGCHLYNEIILVENCGTAGMRVSKQMETRKVVKTHQNILIFYKGDTQKIKHEYKKLKFENIDEQNFDE